MALLSLQRQLLALECAPDDERLFEPLKRHISPMRAGNDRLLRLLEAARAKHAQRGQFRAAAMLIELEAALSSDDADFVRALRKEVIRIYAEELFDFKAAQDAYASIAEQLSKKDATHKLSKSIKADLSDIPAAVERYVEQGRATGDTDALLRAASLCWASKQARLQAQAGDILVEALRESPDSSRAAHVYASALVQLERAADAVDVLKTTVKHISDRREKIGLLLRAAHIARQHLNEIDPAHALYEDVLRLEPGNWPAIEAIGRYHAQRDDIDEARRHYERALRTQKDVAVQSEILAAYGELLQRDHEEESKEVYARLRKLDPAHPKALLFARNVSANDPAKLRQALEEALGFADDPEIKKELGLELAQIAESQQDSTRAIRAWQEVLRVDPENAAAQASLHRLLQETGHWNAVVDGIRDQLEKLAPDAVDERVKRWVELARVYRDELKLPAMAGEAYEEVLKLRPTDREASDTLHQLYRESGRWNELIGVLELEANALTVSAQKVKLYQQISEIWEKHLSDTLSAAKAWEQIVSLDPSQSAARARLKETYTQRRDWLSLYRILSLEVEHVSGAQERAEAQQALAELCSTQLKKRDEAIQLWQTLADDKKFAQRALEELEKLASQGRDYELLIDVLERRVDWTRDKKEKRGVLERLATLYKEKKDEPEKIAKVWASLLELDPKHRLAKRELINVYTENRRWDALEETYAKQNDWAGLVDALHVVADQSSDPADKVELLKREARVAAEHLDQKVRVRRCYEAIAAIDPEEPEAAKYLLPFYEKESNWLRCESTLAALERKAERDADLASLNKVWTKQRDLYAGPVRDASKAYAYAAKIFETQPDDAANAQALHAIVEQSAAYVEYAELLQSALKKPQVPSALRLELRHKLATVAGEQLGEKRIAAEQLEALSSEKALNAEEVRRLSRYYEELGDTEKLAGLLHSRLQVESDEKVKKRLALRLASLNEVGLTKRDEAYDTYWKAHQQEPQRVDHLQGIVRTASHAGHFKELEAALSLLAERVSDEKEKGQYLVQLGDVRRAQLKNTQGALAAYQQALQNGYVETALVEGITGLQEQAPGLRRKTFSLLAELHARRRDEKSLSTLFDAELGAATDLNLRRNVWLERARLLEEHFEENDQAFAVLRTAFEQTPADALLLDALVEAGRRWERVEDVVSAIQNALRKSRLETSDSVRLTLQLAQIWDEDLGQFDEALPLYARVLELDSQNAQAFEALKRIYTQTESWSDIDELYSQRIATTEDQSARVELMLQHAFLQEDLIRDLKAAAKTYRKIADIDIRQQQATRSLRTLLRKLSDWSALAKLLEQVVLVANSQDGIALHAELADLYIRHLDQAQKGVDHYAQILERDPNHAQALQGLEALVEDKQVGSNAASVLAPVYRAQQASKPLARVLEAILQRSDALDQRFAVCLELADIYQTQAQDLDRAFDKVALALSMHPSDAHLHERLGMLAERTRRVDEQISVLNAVRSGLKPQEEAEILLRIASVQDQHNNIAPSVEDTYRRLLELFEAGSEKWLRAMQGLADYFRRTRRVKDLGRALEQLVQYVQKPIPVFAELADLYQQELQRSDKAISALERWRDVDATNPELFARLRTLLEQGHDWERLAALLLDQAHRLGKDAKATELRIAAAQYFENQLADNSAALEIWRRVRADAGLAQPSAEALIRLTRQAEKWDELAEILLAWSEQVPSVERRVEMRTEAAKILRKHLSDENAALKLWIEVSSDNPDHLEAKEALYQFAQSKDRERALEAARSASVAFMATTEWERAAEMFDVLSTSSDAEGRVSALRQNALIQLHQLKRAERAMDLEERALQEGLSLPVRNEILDEYEQVASKAGEVERFVLSVQKLAKNSSERELRLALNQRAAFVAQRESTDDELARSAFAAILQDDPEKIDALNALIGYERKIGSAQDLVSALERKVHLISDPTVRSELLFEVGSLKENKLKDAFGAIDAYEQVLRIAPNALALDELARLYREQERWEDLASVYERQIENASTKPVDLVFELSDLYSNKIKDKHRAIDALAYVAADKAAEERLLQSLRALLGDHEVASRAAEVLDPIVTRRGLWDEAIDLLRLRLRVTDVNEEKIQFLRRIAEIQERELEQPDEAVKSYGEVFILDPRDQANAERFAELSQALGQWDRLAAYFDRALHEIDIDDEQTIHVARQAAKIFEERLNNLEKAAESYERVHRFDPSDEGVASRLENLYERLERWPDLAALCRERLNFADSHGTQIALLTRLAEITEKRFDKKDEAIGVCREILQLDSDNAFANQALQRLLESEKRWDELGELLSLRLERVSPSPQWNDLACALAQVADTHLHDRQRAVELYGRVLKNEWTHERARAALETLLTDEEHVLSIARLLEPIYESQANWKKLVDVIGAQVERLTDVDEKTARLRSLAQLQESKLRDQYAAFSAWGKAMVLAPEDTSLQEQVDRLAEVLLEWNAWVQTYESAVINCQSATRRAALVLDIARAQDTRLGDPRLAIKSYRRALDEDPWLDQARIELEALLTLVGDWNELVDVLEHQLDFKNDNASRLHLLRRIGSTYEDFLNNPEQAIHAYERALIEDNEDRETLEALDRLYTARNDENKLVEILHRLLSLADHSERQDYAVRLARLHEALGENEQAIEVLQLHVQDPTSFPRAARALAILLEREGRFDELQQHLQLCIAHLKDTMVRSDSLGRLGLLYEQRHRDEEKARVLYEQALSEDAHNGLALDGLLRLARGEQSIVTGQSMIEGLLAQQGRVDELIAIKSLHLTHKQEPNAKLSLQEELAALEEQRGGLDAAFDIRLEIFDSYPDQLAKRENIERLARATGRMQSLLVRIQQAAEKSSDPAIKAKLFCWLAECAKTELKDHERAIFGYQRSLEADFKQPAVVAALDGLLTEGQRWQQLEQLLERRIETAGAGPATDVNSLETRLAGLRWQYLNDEAGALRVLERLLQREPHNLPGLEILDAVLRGSEFSDPSLQLLEATVTTSGDWLRLARAYEERAAREKSGQRAQWLLKGAGIYDKKQEKTAAFAMRLQAFEDHPDSQGLFSVLRTQAVTEEQKAALLSIVDNIDNAQNLDPENLVMLYIEAADWCTTQNRHLTYAQKYLQRAVALDPESEVANTRLVAACRELSDVEGAVRALWQWADSSVEVAHRVERWRQAAELISGDSRWLPLAGESYQKIVNSDPTNTSAMQALIAIRRKEEKWEELARLLELLAETSGDKDERIAALSELSALFRRKLRNPTRAVQYMEQLRALQPDSEDFGFQLADVYEELGRHEDLVALLEQQVATEKREEPKVALHLQLADILNKKLKNNARALSHFRSVLNIRSTHPIALEAVEKTLTSERRWEELTEFLIEQANQAEAQGQIDQAVALLDRAALIYKEKRKDRRSAMRVFERVIDMDPKQELALRHAAQLAEDLGEADTMILALERLIPLVPTTESVSLAKRIAAIAPEEIAERALKLAFQTSGGASEVREALEAHYLAKGRYDSLSSLLEDAIRVEIDTQARAQLLMRLAGLYREHLQQDLEAIRCLEEARVLAPQDSSILETLANLYSTQGRDHEALPVLEAIVSSYDGKRNKKVVPYLQRLAAALRAHGRTQDALIHLERAAKLDSNNVIVLRDLGLSCYEMQDWDRAQKALRNLLLQTIGPQDGVSKADVYFYLGDIAGRLGDTERAENMLERALGEQSDHARSRQKLAELKGRA